MSTATRRVAGAGLVAGVLAIFGVTSAVLFVVPAHDAPGPADVIFVPNGEGDRVGRALALAETGLAPVLAVSVDRIGYPCPREQPPVELLCFRPQPFTTQGEARWLGAMAAARGWRRVMVVVSTSQATHVRLRIRRCFPGSLRIVTIPIRPTRIPKLVTYEWGALVKALAVQRGC